MLNICHILIGPANHVWGSFFMPKRHFCFSHGHGLPFPNPKTRNTYHERTAYPRTKDQSAQLRGHICDHATGFAAREQDTPQPRAFLGGGPQPQQQNIVRGAHWPGGQQPGERRPARCV